MWFAKVGTGIARIAGSTDSSGLYSGEDIVGKAVRIYADGYSFADFATFEHPDDGKANSRNDISLVSLHSGFYSAFNGVKRRTLWHAASTGEYFYFSAHGLFEYRSDPETPDGSTYHYVAPSQVGGWTGCSIRQTSFPVGGTGRGLIGKSESYDAFRFGSPGTMTARKQNDQMGPKVEFLAID